MESEQELPEPSAAFFVYERLFMKKLIDPFAGEPVKRAALLEGVGDPLTATAWALDSGVPDERVLLLVS
jgi:hypothetical protein